MKISEIWQGLLGDVFIVTCDSNDELVAAIGIINDHPSVKYKLQAAGCWNAPFKLTVRPKLLSKFWWPCLVYSCHTALRRLNEPSSND